jgi:hypothetical protein
MVGMVFLLVRDGAVWWITHSAGNLVKRRRDPETLTKRNARPARIDTPG